MERVSSVLDDCVTAMVKPARESKVMAGQTPRVAKAHKLLRRSKARARLRHLFRRSLKKQVGGFESLEIFSPLSLEIYFLSLEILFSLFFFFCDYRKECVGVRIFQSIVFC